jgi:hypothetical protein
MVGVHIIPYPNFQFLTMIDCNFTYKSSVKFLKTTSHNCPFKRMLSMHLIISSKCWSNTRRNYRALTLTVVWLDQIANFKRNLIPFRAVTKGENQHFQIM